VFERDGLLDSLNREGCCNVWELVAQRERAEGLNEKTREVLWPARYLESTVRKGHLSPVCTSRLIRVYTKKGEILVFFFLSLYMCVRPSGRVELLRWIVPGDLALYFN
jgi:hypothetical protein